MAVVERYRGTDWDLRLTVTKTDGDKGRQDLTGATLEYQIKASPGAADPALLAKAVGTGITLLAQSGDTLGQADIAVTAAEAQALVPDVVWEDVVAVIGGKRKVVVKPRKVLLKHLVNQP